MASIEKVSTGYRARWRTPDNKSRSQTFRRKIDAERHLTAIEHAKLTATYVDPSAGRISFRRYAEGWREAQVHRRGTASQIETNLRRHVYPRLGDRPIGAIRPSEVQALVKAMMVGDEELELEPLAPSTVNVAYTWVATIFRAAVHDRVIAVSPCRSIRLPEIHRGRVSPLAVDVVDELVEQISPRYRALVVLGAGTGVRISEALGLTNDRVDWLRRRVTIDRQLVRAAGEAPVFGPVKDKRNRPRTVPLPDVVLEELSAHVARFELGPDGLLFTGPRGGAVHRSTFSDAWKAAAGPLGIPLGEGFHQLRHFYASLLIAHGESVKVVQERLGHTSVQMTVDVYGHLWPEDEDRTRAAVDEVLRGRTRDEGARLSR